MNARHLERPVRSGRWLAALAWLAACGILGLAGTEAGAQGELWTTKAPMPTPRAWHATVVVDGRVYAIGGWVKRGSSWEVLATVEAYDPLTDTWTARAGMPTARCGLAAAVLDGRIYAIGGEDAEVQALATVEAYDPVTDTWTTQAPLAHPRRWLAAAAVDGRLYAIGGLASQRIELRDGLRWVEAYDPATDAWTEKAPLPTGRGDMPAVAVGGKVLTIGGWRPNVGGWVTGDVYEYDPLADRWRTRAGVPANVIDQSAMLWQGRVYIFHVETAMYVYDPQTDQWSRGPVAPLAVARPGVAGVVVDDRFYIIGGSLASEAQTGTVDVLELAMPERVNAGTRELVAEAGTAVDLPIEVTLSAPAADGTYPAIGVDLSALGADPMVHLTHQGSGRYAGRVRIEPAINGQFVLPVRMAVPQALPRYLYSIDLKVWPTSAVPILAEGLAPGWQTQTSSLENLALTQASVVYAGTSACAVTTRKTFSGWVLSLQAPAPIEPFGYDLHLAIHPGDVTPAATDRLTLSVGGGTKTVDLLSGGLVDWGRREWQELDVPLSTFGAEEPIAGVQLSGKVVGTLYLDEVRLVAGQAPALTAVLETRAASQPQGFSLRQNYPNPFNSGTVIRFDLPAAGEVAVVVYNLAGQPVATLATGARSDGSYALTWDGRDDQGRELASGVYVCHLRLGDQAQTRKLVVVR